MKENQMCFVNHQTPATFDNYKIRVRVYVQCPHIIVLP